MYAHNFKLIQFSYYVACNISLLFAMIVRLSSKFFINIRRLTGQLTPRFIAILEWRIGSDYTLLSAVRFLFCDHTLKKDWEHFDVENIYVGGVISIFTTGGRAKGTTLSPHKSHEYNKYDYYASWQGLFVCRRCPKAHYMTFEIVVKLLTRLVSLL